MDPILFYLDDDYEEFILLNECFKTIHSCVKINYFSTLDALLDDKRSPCAFLIDLNMPIPGGEVICTLNQIDKFRGVPKLILSTSRDPSEINKCYILGAEAYFVKPFDMNDFITIASEIDKICCRKVKEVN